MRSLRTDGFRQIYTVSKDGALFRWQYGARAGDPEELSDRDAEERWRILKKDFFLQNNAKVNCATFHAASNLLVVGFSNGLFGLYELPEFNQIHLLRYAVETRRMKNHANTT